MLRMAGIRGLATGLLRPAILSAVAVVAVGAPGAAQASPAPVAGGSATHCVIKLAKLEPGQTESRVISSECVTGNQQPTAAQGDYLLMTWYQHMDYQGNSTKVYGDAACDTYGYGISYTGWLWKNSMSSYRVFNRCNLSRMYTDKNYGGVASSWKNGSQHYLGRTFNDNVGSLWIKRG